MHPTRLNRLEDPKHRFELNRIEYLYYLQSVSLHEVVSLTPSTPPS